MIKRRPVLWRIAFAIIVAALLGSIPFVFAGASQIPSMVSMVFPEDQSEKGACPNGYVALTFDDGPDPVITPQISQALRNGGARGTFFVVGARAEAHPEIVRQIRAEGMEVGNHTYDHPFLDELSPDQLRDQMIVTNEIIDGTGGPAPTLFRPPYGRTNGMVQETARALGMTEVLWTYDSDDYAQVTVDQMMGVAAKAKNGDVLLFHDLFPSTVQAIPRILADFSARGICSGRIVPSGTPTQAWLDYDGDDRAYYGATTARW